MAHFFMTWHAQPLPEYTLPDGFSIRTYRPGDEADWLRCCTGCELGVESWTDGQFERDMLQRAGITPESIFFVTDSTSRIAATATAICQEKHGYVHMVASDPAYRGKTLGKAVCHVVMRYLVDKGYDTIVLETDDWRVPAIRVYQWLGFERDKPANSPTQE